MMQLPKVLAKLVGAGVILGLMGCPEPMRTDVDAETKEDGSDSGESSSKSTSSGPSQSFAVPQETLANDKNAIKVTGELVVEGYETGVLQIDITQGDGPPEPISVARFNKPGPFTIYLPSTVEKVNLTAILDFDSDGPTAKDPQIQFSGNPLKVSDGDVKGINLEIDIDSAPEPPPDDGGEGEGEGDKKATEGDKSTEGAPAEGSDGEQAQAGGDDKGADAKSAEPKKKAAPPPPAPGLQSPDQAPEKDVSQAPTPVPVKKEKDGDIPDILKEEND